MNVTRTASNGSAQWDEVCPKCNYGFTHAHEPSPVFDFFSGAFIFVIVFCLGSSLCCCLLMLSGHAYCGLYTGISGNDPLICQNIERAWNL